MYIYIYICIDLPGAGPTFPDCFFLKIGRTPKSPY